MMMMMMMKIVLMCQDLLCIDLILVLEDRPHFPSVTTIINLLNDHNHNHKQSLSQGSASFSLPHYLWNIFPILLVI